ncbi:PTS sugar transporter subunit IIA [Lactobacillus sp. ESL0677]|uniref:BglG family transcription antiterminator n=1 Tax=Lactobacillus sp. ESL0677 TaxID=2983208 RepID=UPI0023F7C946|nr:PTS sugar transporter subunit IIA [Lactobacillus sp. ESL0677]WEV37646.1 PTS sugar transporter subunit IIA [Lactobacillus sp. ESL0677]
MKLSYKRLSDILSVLLRNTTNKYLSASYIAKKFNVSTRTIRSDINELNKELVDFDVEIKNKRGAGFYIKNLDSEKRSKLLDIVHNNVPATNFVERINEVEQFLLVNNRSNLLDLTTNLFISDNTFFAYLVTIKKDFEDFNLKISRKGDVFSVIGTEAAKRNFIISKLVNKKSNSYIIDFTKQERAIFKNVDLEKLKNLIHGFLRHYSYRIPDMNTKNIILHTALTISRDKMGFHLEAAAKVKVKKVVLLTLQKLISQIEASFSVSFNEYEKKDLIYHFAMNYPECMEIDENTQKGIKDSVDTFLLNIKKEFAVDLTKDTELHINLIQHLSNLVKIKDSNGSRKNPLLSVILSTFPYAYEITAYATPILERQLDLKLNDDEISFITLHIGAAIERQDKISTKKRVALICGTGVSTAALVRAKLQAQFSSFLEITGTYTYDEYLEGNALGNDFLISTIPINDSKIPVVQIDLTNFHNDIIQLSDYLKSLINPYRAIDKLFDEENIYLIDHVVTKEQLLNMLIKQLESKKIVTKDYLSKVYEREKMYSTAIGGKIAVPHSLGYATNISKVSFARLSKPIKWDDKNEVKYVFLLAIARKDYLSVQKLFDFIVDLQTNSTFRQIIDKSNKSQDIKEAFSSLIKSSY